MAEPTNVTTKPSRKHAGDVLRGWSGDDKRAYITALKGKLKGADGQSWLDYLNSERIKGSELYRDYAKYAREDPNATFAEANGERPATDGGEVKPDTGEVTDNPRTTGRVRRERPERPRHEDQRGARERRGRALPEDTTGLLSSDSADPNARGSVRDHAPVTSPTIPPASVSDATERREQYKRPDRRGKRPPVPLLHDQVTTLKDDLRRSEGFYDVWLRKFDGKPDLTELYTRTYREPAADVDLRERVKDLDRKLRGAGAQSALDDLYTVEDKDVLEAEYKATYGKSAQEAARNSKKPMSDLDITIALGHSIGLEQIPDKFTPELMKEIWKDKKKRASFFRALRDMRTVHPDIVNQFFQLNDGKGGVKQYFEKFLTLKRAHSKAAGQSTSRKWDLPKDPRGWEKFLTTGEWFTPADFRIRNVAMTSPVYRVAKEHTIDPSTLVFLYAKSPYIWTKIGRTVLRRVCIGTLKTLTTQEIVVVAGGKQPEAERFRHHLRYYAREVPNSDEKLKLLNQQYRHDAKEFNMVQ